MNWNFIFANTTEALPVLLKELSVADEVGSRNGRTRELTHVGITLTRPWERELLLTGRRHSLVAQIAETMWVLAGRHDVEWLARYLPRAADYSDDGLTWRGAYGARLRSWGSNQIDQLAYVIETLRREPLSRQAVMTMWDPAIDHQPGRDIPCNNWLSFTSRLGRLDLHVAVRSNDVMWGWSGINAFEWSALQEVVACLLGLDIGRLHFSITSLHLYERHWARAAAIEPALVYWPALSPQFDPPSRTLNQFDLLVDKWFNLEERIRTGTPVGIDVENFPEPMLRSWLQVLQWWWTGDVAALDPLKDTRLRASALLATTPTAVTAPPPISPFLVYVNALHAEKHAAYGNSWKRRGELIGVLANIARKVDRLGANTSDETSADTAVDLLLYLGKYRWWLVDNRSEPKPVPLETTWEQFSDLVEPVSALLEEVERRNADADADVSALEESLTANFARLETLEILAERAPLVDAMLDDAYLLARKLYQP